MEDKKTVELIHQKDSIDVNGNSAALRLVVEGNFNNDEGALERNDYNAVDVHDDVLGCLERKHRRPLVLLHDAILCSAIAKRRMDDGAMEHVADIYDGVNKVHGTSYGVQRCFC